MASEKVRRYIEEHSFCPKLLFREWEPFLDLLYAEGGAVSAICWWGDAVGIALPRFFVFRTRTRAR